MNVKLLSSARSFGGEQRRYVHASAVNNCDMNFSIYLPPQALSGTSCPVVYWLSGLTCTDENFIQKAGAQKLAAQLGLIIVAPDTSPRGESVADDPAAAWDFGLGAGFYLDATEPPWHIHYNMYSYITLELPQLVNDTFETSGKTSISGHSMGGHGALICAIKNATQYQSVSAFAPITHPSLCPWGQKAFGNYLGKDKQQWLNWDSVELIKKNGFNLPLLVDQGGADDFLETQLRTNDLADLLTDNQVLRIQKGYDHSYFFIASFIDEHLRFHAQYLLKE